MPSFRGFRCSLRGSEAGDAGSNCQTSGRGSTFPESCEAVDYDNGIVSCFAAVKVGTLQVVLKPQDCDMDHVLVRIEIDGSPRVQRLVPLEHKSATPLLRFRGSEYDDNGELQLEQWTLKPITLKCLRSQVGKLRYGVIKVSLHPVSRPTPLQYGGCNHEIRSFVEKSASWSTPAIPMLQYQEDRLSFHVAHLPMDPEMTTTSSHKAAVSAYAYAMGHDWEVCADPHVVFVYRYRQEEVLSKIMAENKADAPFIFPSYNETGQGNKRRHSLSDDFSSSTSLSSSTSTCDTASLHHDDFRSCSVKLQKRPRRLARSERDALDAGINESTDSFKDAANKIKCNQAQRLTELKSCREQLADKEDQAAQLAARARYLAYEHAELLTEEAAKLERMSRRVNTNASGLPTPSTSSGSSTKNNSPLLHEQALDEHIQLNINGSHTIQPSRAIAKMSRRGAHQIPSQSLIPDLMSARHHPGFDHESEPDDDGEL